MEAPIVVIAAQIVYSIFFGYFALLAALALHARRLVDTRVLAHEQFLMCGWAAVYCAVGLVLAIAPLPNSLTVIALGLTAVAGTSTLRAYLAALSSYLGTRFGWIEWLRWALLLWAGGMVLLCVSHVLLDFPEVFDASHGSLSNVLLDRVYRGRKPALAPMAWLGAGALLMISTLALLWQRLGHRLRRNRLLWFGLWLSILCAINDLLMGGFDIPYTIPLAFLGYVVEAAVFQARLIRVGHQTQVEARSELRRLQGLAETSHLAFHLTHEIKGILRELPSDRASRGLIYLDQLSRFLLLKWKGGETGPSECDMGVVIQDALRFLEPQLAESGVRVQVEVDSCVTLPMAREEGVLVFVNLMRNSLRVLSTTEPAARWIRVRGSVEEGGKRILITFQDGGPGFEAERVSQLFQIPRDGKPTGFGLAIVRETLLASGALIELAGPGPRPLFRIRFLVSPIQKT